MIASQIKKALGKAKSSQSKQEPVQSAVKGKQ